MCLAMHRLIAVHLAMGSEDNKSCWVGCRFRQGRRGNRRYVHQMCMLLGRSSPIAGLFDLGFSWVEIGSVTPKPQVRLKFCVSDPLADHPLDWQSTSAHVPPSRGLSSYQPIWLPFSRPCICSFAITSSYSVFLLSRPLPLDFVFTAGCTTRRQPGKEQDLSTRVN